MHLRICHANASVIALTLGSVDLKCIIALFHDRFTQCSIIVRDDASNRGLRSIRSSKSRRTHIVSLRINRSSTLLVQITHDWLLLHYLHFVMGTRGTICGRVDSTFSQNDFVKAAEIVLRNLFALVSSHILSIALQIRLHVNNFSRRLEEAIRLSKGSLFGWKVACYWFGTTNIILDEQHIVALS